MTALKIQNPDSENGEKMAQVEEKKQDKKIEMRISGGGIGGLLILGGVLAAAALVAALRNRSKRRPTNKIIKDPPTDPSEEHESKKEGDGARSVLQTPSLSLENNQRYIYVFLLFNKEMSCRVDGFFPCVLFDSSTN